MSQGPLCPNLSQKVQKEVSQMANHNLPCMMLLENTMQVKMIRHVCVRGISQMQSLKERVKKEKGLPGVISFVAMSLAIFSN